MCRTAPRQQLSSRKYFRLFFRLPSLNTVILGPWLGLLVDGLTHAPVDALGFLPKALVLAERIFLLERVVLRTG